MKMNLFIALLLLVAVGVEFSQGLQCYAHDYCIIGCPTLATTVVQCGAGQNKCWKLKSPLGVKRGCGDNRCSLQVDVGALGTANICCADDLCNAARPTASGSLLALVLSSSIAFFYAWCM